MEWNRTKQNETEWNRMKQNETEQNRMKQNEMDWNGLKWNKSEQTHTDRSALNGAERSETGGRDWDLNLLKRKRFSISLHAHTERNGMGNGMEWNGMKQNETEWNRTKQNEMDWNGFLKWNKSEQTHTDRSALNGGERSGTGGRDWDLNLLKRKRFSISCLLYTSPSPRD